MALSFCIYVLVICMVSVLLIFCRHFCHSVPMTPVDFKDAHVTAESYYNRIYSKVLLAVTHEFVFLGSRSIQVGLDSVCTCLYVACITLIYLLYESYTKYKKTGKKRGRETDRQQNAISTWTNDT